MNKVTMLTALLLALFFFTSNVGASDLPDYLYSKGGIIYPSTGDSTQAIFRTQPEVMEYLKPGMLIGVLPEDCNPSSYGTLGDIYICHYDLILKPEEMNGKTVYRVIELN
jgi:hypothetical protein